MVVKTPTQSSPPITNPPRVAGLPPFLSSVRNKHPIFNYPLIHLLNSYSSLICICVFQRFACSRRDGWALRLLWVGGKSHELPHKCSGWTKCHCRKECQYLVWRLRPLTFVWRIHRRLLPWSLQDHPFLFCYLFHGEFAIISSFRFSTFLLCLFEEVKQNIYYAFFFVLFCTGNDFVGLISLRNWRP